MASSASSPARWISTQDQSYLHLLSMRLSKYVEFVRRSTSSLKYRLLTRRTADAGSPPPPHQKADTLDSMQ